MIQTANDIFVLHTAQTTYAFRKLPTGQLEHLYYGRKIHVCEPLDENAVAPLIEKHTFQPGNSCVYDREHDAYTLEDLCLEMSAYGKGDIREPFVELIYEDGSFSSDFVYESSVRFEGREARDAEDALPASYDEKNQVEHLCVTLKDNNSALKLELHYYIYEDCDVITRSAKLINDGENAVQIRRLMSCQVDFPTSDHVFTSFHGAWAMDIPGKNHSEGRNQRLLDLSRAEVQDYIIGQMSDLFSSANIAYVKWDMNRIVTDYYSKTLPPERQGEVAHRYVLGLYRCMKELTERFPEILFEGCAAGGNRFDLGILSYFPQIWASDDTDALCRAEIQTGYSYGYPMSVVSAHVSSCPNHQTLRMTPLETRFQVAAFGICGYECNFCDMKKEDFDAVKAQIALYKEWRKVLQTGSFYRGRNFSDQGSVLGSSAGNIQEWTCVSEDREKAVGFLMQKLVSPNTQFEYYRPNGLNPEARYHFYNRSLKYNVKEFGDLVNTVAPVHIRQDSVAHNLIAKFVKMDGEAEDFCAYGDALMYAGVKLKQAFGGTGYNEQIRHFPDFASRMYFMEQMND